jgi:hypothetical protein
MSRAAIAAVLARDDLSASERLVAFSLASFADGEARARPGTPAAAARAGLKRSSFLGIRNVLVRRGLVVIQDPATGRGRASGLWLPFVETGPWWDGDINAALVEPVLGYSGARGAARLLLAAAAALADERRVVEGVTTRQFCAAAGLSGTTYRRARIALLASGELVLRSGTGGRGKANCWELADPRSCADAVEATGRRRVVPAAGQRPLLAIASSAPAVHVGSVSAVNEFDPVGEDRLAGAVKGAGDRTLSAQNRPAGGGASSGKGAGGRTLSGENRPAGGGVSSGKGAAGRTVSRETPPQTPPDTPPHNARAGRNPRTPEPSTPPNPPKGGSGGDSILVEETYITERGRRRPRLVAVDLGVVRERLRAAGEEDLPVWERVRALLREAVGESTFDLWLAPLELIALDLEGALVVSAPRETVGWVARRFGRILDGAAERAGRQLRVADELERQAAESLPSAAKRDCQSPGTATDTSTYSSSYGDVYNRSMEVS